MPLGKLSLNQLEKVESVLFEIHDVLVNKKDGDLNLLSSQFYTLMPHNFKRQKPPVIDDLSLLTSKIEIISMLKDISTAQALKKVSEKTEKHQLDALYEMLNCELEFCDRNYKHYDLINDYFKVPDMSTHSIKKIWRVKRPIEENNLKNFADIKNRKFLWHGTRDACVLAILNKGLIIPERRYGRLGCGIYFSSQSIKSISYSFGRTRFMFLAEVVLGNEFKTYNDLCNLVKPPDGHHSVVGQASKDFASENAKILELEGRELTVPHGNYVSQSFKSQFYNMEYVIYNTFQYRLHYLVEVE